MDRERMGTNIFCAGCSSSSPESLARIVASDAVSDANEVDAARTVANHGVVARTMPTRTMPFGMYKGMALSDVPDAYVEWMKCTTDFFLAEALFGWFQKWNTSEFIQV